MAIPSTAPDTVEGDDEKRQGVSNVELVSAMADKDAFYDLYIQITNRAIELYARAGRRKFAIKLHGDLAALDL